MKNLRYRFESQTLFSNPVSEHSFMLKIMPSERCSQTVVDSMVEITPSNARMESGRDFWGNNQKYGIVREPHREFSYLSAGIVQVTGNPEADPSPLPVFLTETPLTQFHAEMDNMLVRDSNLKSAMKMALLIRDNLQYVTGSTNVMTTALEAFVQGKGVCQDFAHILISLCREQGIPARYICGFVLGEGLTHAWTEIWHDGKWYAIDPTAGKLCDDSYIVTAIGRDAHDCSVSRGIYFGISDQKTYTKVTVDEI